MSKDAHPRSGGALRFASWGAGLAMLGWGGKLLYLAPHPDNPSDILSQAEQRGLIPVDAQPGLGTQIYQWDAEIPEVAPYRIGPVVKLGVMLHKRPLVAVQQTKHSRLLIDIKPGDMRYWVLK